MLFGIGSMLAFSAVMTYFYSCYSKEDKGINGGVCYGLFAGLLLGSVSLGTYCYMPIPLELTLSWVVSDIVQGVGSGVVLSFLYKG